MSLCNTVYKNINLYICWFGVFVPVSVRFSFIFHVNEHAKDWCWRPGCNGRQQHTEDTYSSIPHRPNQRLSEHAMVRSFESIRTFPMDSICQMAPKQTFCVWTYRWTVRISMPDELWMSWTVYLIDFATYTRESCRTVYITNWITHVTVWCCDSVMFCKRCRILCVFNVYCMFIMFVLYYVFICMCCLSCCRFSYFV